MKPRKRTLLNNPPHTDYVSDRVSAYQYKISEVNFDDKHLVKFSNSRGMYSPPNQYNEEILDLEDQLKERTWDLIKTNLSQREIDVITLFVQGLTQWEITKHVDTCQANVSRILRGFQPKIKQSKPNEEPTFIYGEYKKGAIEKMQDIVNNDKTIQSILAQLSELKSEIL